MATARETPAAFKDRMSGLVYEWQSQRQDNIDGVRDALQETISGAMRCATGDNAAYIIKHGMDALERLAKLEMRIKEAGAVRVRSK